MYYFINVIIFCSIFLFILVLEKALQVCLRFSVYHSVIKSYYKTRGVTVHKYDGSVHTSILTSQFGEILVQWGVHSVLFKQL